MSILYGSLLSPFVRKVHITLEIKQLTYTVEELIPFLKSDKERLLTLSPLGKVPIYQDEIHTLADSSVICAYLNKRYPQMPLYPNNPSAYGQSLWYEEYADVELTPTIAQIFFHTLVAPRLDLPQDLNLVNTLLKEKIPHIFYYLNQHITHKNYLVGEQLSIADVSVVGSLMTFELSGNNIDQQRWPNLNDYYTQHIMKEPTIKHVYLQIKDLFNRKRFRAQ